MLLTITPSMLISALVIFIALAFFIMERVRPGRGLPNSRGWYVRALFLNLAQYGVVTLAGVTWEDWLHGSSWLDIASVMPSPVQGVLAWFIGTFIFYWWHRIRHDSDFLWRSLHQIHHSASRIEALTAFYKHPAEMIVNSVIISLVLFTMLGADLEAAAWFNLFAVSGEFFYHSNIKTPHWVGYFMQRPEHHSIHHQYDVHKFNFGDITLWDRLFGTFKDTREFAPRCGFDEGKEEQIGKMLVWVDVNRAQAARS